MEIRFDDTIRGAAPGLTVVTVESDVTNVETSDELWSLLVRACDDIRSVTELSDINKRPGIKATRDVYKALGKEPNRYRPSSEALCRRAVKGLSYIASTRLSTLSMCSRSCRATPSEDLTRQRLTVMCSRSESVAKGSRLRPSDAGCSIYAACRCIATIRAASALLRVTTSVQKLDLSTTRLLMCINIYGEEMPADDVAGMAVNLLEKYAEANNITINYFRP